MFKTSYPGLKKLYVAHYDSHFEVEDYVKDHKNQEAAIRAYQAEYKKLWDLQDVKKGTEDKDAIKKQQGQVDKKAADVPKKGLTEAKIQQAYKDKKAFYDAFSKVASAERTDFHTFLSKDYANDRAVADVAKQTKLVKQ